MASPLIGGPVGIGSGTYNTSWLDPKAQYQSDQNIYDAQQAELNRDFTGDQNAARNANDLAIAQLPIDWAKSKYANATGTGLYQSLTGAFNPSLVGGTNTGQSPITQGPVWTDQQIDQQVNQSKSNNQQTAATQNQQITSRAAGQGFATRSPLVAALQGQTNASLMANNAKSEQDIRWNSAEGNARHTLDTQKAAEEQWANWNDADIRRRQAAASGTSSLLAALGAFT
jgi:hypothetical protein